MPKGRSLGETPIPRYLLYLKKEIIQMAKLMALAISLSILISSVAFAYDGGGGGW